MANGGPRTKLAGQTLDPGCEGGGRKLLNHSGPSVSGGEAGSAVQRRVFSSAESPNCPSGGLTHKGPITIRGA